MSGVSAPEFIDKFKILLDARGDLAALDHPPKVYTHWPTADYSTTDEIIIGYSIRSPREPAAVGRNRVDETPIVDSQIRILRAGAGEEVAKAARDAGKVLITAVDHELRTNHPELADLNDDVLWARIGTYDIDQFPDPGRGEPPVPLRVCVYTFEIHYRARVAV